MERRLAKGILCIIFSAFGFALMAMFVRLADECGEPLPAIQKALFRNIVAAAVAGWAFFGRPAGVRRAARTPSSLGEWSDLLFRCVFGTLGIFANFYALTHIPVGSAMALNRTAPFFTLIASWILLGERMSARQTLCVAGAFAGAMLVIKPGFDGMFSVPAMVGLSSGFGAGAAYAFLHRLGKSGIDGSFIILFFSLFSIAACVPFLATGLAAMSCVQVCVLLGAGMSAALGQFGITWAYRFAEPRQVAVYDYSGIVFASVFGFLAFGQIPDALSIAGFAAIIGMGFLLHCSRGRVQRG